jgi:predicted anti-sigma-YlaC factor YlaD
MEAQALVEDALDEALTGNRRRALDLHLSRCDACRAFFAAEKEEHRRWFGAMNDPAVCRRLPEGFAEEFLASLAHGKAAPQKRWAFVGMFRRIAAVLAAMLLFAGLSYAAAVAVDILGGDEANQKIAEDEASKVADSQTSVSEPVAIPAMDEIVSDESLSGGAAIALSEPYNQPTGGNAMTKRKAAAAALSVAMAAAPLAAADVEAYQYIISTPYPEANAHHSLASSPTTVNSGALRVAGIAKELEARYRSSASSFAVALNALEFKTFIITVR